MDTDFKIKLDIHLTWERSFLFICCSLSVVIQYCAILSDFEKEEITPFYMNYYYFFFFFFFPFFSFSFFYLFFYFFFNNLANMKSGTESSKTASTSNNDTVDQNLSERDEAKNKKSSSMIKHATDSVVIYEANYDEPTPSTVQQSVVIKSPIAKDSLYYNMSLKHRGNCIVFNHTKFENGLDDDRVGTDVDEAAIKRTFGSLGFNVSVHPDLTNAEINTKIYELTQVDYTDHSCICIFVLTHGDSNGQLRSRDSSYPLNFMWKQFTADRCRTLGAKPKLFFIQACRGKEVESGMPMCSRSETDSSNASYKLPVHADFLIGYSTVEDHVSWRNPKDGSWYVQTLCDVIDANWRTTDLVKMLTMTSRIVATTYQSQHDNPSKNGMVQMPTFTSTLTRDVLFTP